MGTYKGYLEAYVPQIVADYQAGLRGGEIVARLPRTIHYYGDGPTHPSSSMVRHVLLRLGYIHNHPYRSVKHRYVPTEWKSNKGRPIDMGGPRDRWIDRDPWSEL